MQRHATEAGFQTTGWSFVEELASGDDHRRHDAAERLARVYWRPIYGWLRRSGQDRHQAEEITQGFFADVIITRRLFERAEPGRGRLRTLILVALKRYVIDQYRRDAARGSQRQVPLASVEFEEQALVAEGPTDPEEWFDRRWAAAVLEESLHRCEQHYAASGRSDHWALFEQRTLRPASASVDPPSLAELAERLGLRSDRAAASMLQQVRRRVMGLMREVIAESAVDDAEQEFADVLALLE